MPFRPAMTCFTSLSSGLLESRKLAARLNRFGSRVILTVWTALLARASKSGSCSWPCNRPVGLPRVGVVDVGLAHVGLAQIGLAHASAASSRVVNRFCKRLRITSVGFTAQFPVGSWLLTMR